MCLQIYIYLYNAINCHLLTNAQLTIQLPANRCPTINTTSPHPQQQTICVLLTLQPGHRVMHGYSAPTSMLHLLILQFPRKLNFQFHPAVPTKQ